MGSECKPQASFNQFTFPCRPEGTTTKRFQTCAPVRSQQVDTAGQGQAVSRCPCSTSMHQVEGGVMSVPSIEAVMLIGRTAFSWPDCFSPTTKCWRNDAGGFQSRFWKKEGWRNCRLKGLLLHTVWLGCWVYHLSFILLGSHHLMSIESQTYTVLVAVATNCNTLLSPGAVRRIWELCRFTRFTVRCSCRGVVKNIPMWKQKVHSVLSTQHPLGEGLLWVLFGWATLTAKPMHQ